MLSQPQIKRRRPVNIEIDFLEDSDGRWDKILDLIEGDSDGLGLTNHLERIIGKAHDVPKQQICISKT